MSHAAKAVAHLHDAIKVMDIVDFYAIMAQNNLVVSKPTCCAAGIVTLCW
jgi:hypothetical protein